MIQYNTLYQSLKKVSGDWHAGHVETHFYWDYIKFFLDNTFIMAPITGDDFDLINTKFVKENSDLTHGVFTEKGNVLSLTINNTSILGSIKKDGSLIVKGKINWDLFTPVSY